QLRKIVMKIPKSPTVILPLWRDTCLDMNLKPVLIPRDVSTRWNSTHDMLKIALQYREVVDVIVDHKKAGLRKFELEDEEWDSLADLFKVLKHGSSTLFHTTHLLAVLHPGIKLKYFARHEWPQEWIDEVREIVRGVYTTYAEQYRDAGNVCSRLGCYQF
ncbi:hypothetical protein C8R43DRAFT_892792, partial [Mycena crocata]